MLESPAPRPHGVVQQIEVVQFLVPQLDLLKDLLDKIGLLRTHHFQTVL
jgi:hypothetical protein